MRFSVGALVGLVVGVVGFAGAAQADPTGTWQCQLANQPNQPNPYDTWMYQFTLQLTPDGRGFAQGTYYAQSAGYNEPFQAQGQWQETQDHSGMTFQGQAMKQSGQTPFVLVLKYYSAQQMSYRVPVAAGVMVQACQR